jgi:hypothetical protein
VDNPSPVKTSCVTALRSFTRLFAVDLL